MARQAACGLLLAVLAVAGRAEAGMTATLSRRRHSAGGNDLFAPGDPLPPCAKVECPPVAIEIPVPQLGASLRKYDPLRWVTLHSSARWKGNDGEGYKDSFLVRRPQSPPPPPSSARPSYPEFLALLALPQAGISWLAPCISR